jgi:hypothetical protein
MDIFFDISLAVGQLLHFATGEVNWALVLILANHYGFRHSRWIWGCQLNLIMMHSVVGWAIRHPLNVLGKWRSVFSVTEPGLWVFLLEHVFALLTWISFFKASSLGPWFYIWQCLGFLLFYRVRINLVNSGLWPMIINILRMAHFKLWFSWSRFGSCDSNDVIRIHSSIHS